MKDRETDVLQQYDLGVVRTGRARGGILLFTDDERYLLKECNKSEVRLNFESQIHEALKEDGIILSDSIIKNNEGEFISKDTMLNSYIVKKWYEAEECIPTDQLGVCNAAKILGMFHKTMSGRIDREGIVPENNLIEDYKRYNIELKRARNYIRGKRHKSDFELKLMSDFDSFYSSCEETVSLLDESNYKKLYEEALVRGELVHGEYNHHNILYLKKENKYVMINFDFANVNLKIYDVYYFLRKIMEKNNWEISLGMSILESYDKENSISQDERNLLKILLMYPEKFRKVVNHYYNSNKAWIPGKNMEKLILVHKQMELRENFVKYL